MLTLLPNTTEPLKVTLLPILTSLPVFSCPSIKQEDGSLKKTPFFAALPDATVITVGVAKPNAHGQAITKTAIDN